MVVPLPNVASAAWSYELSISVIVACRVAGDVPCLSSTMQLHLSTNTVRTFFPLESSQKWNLVIDKPLEKAMLCLSRASELTSDPHS